MMRITPRFAWIALLLALAACAGVKPGLGRRETRASFTLEKVVQVKGRQGVACGGDHLFVSGSRTLYKYDWDGRLLLANEEPFRGWGEKLNHLGDIDYYDGELYTGAERFEQGRGWDIQIAIFDADTLQYKRSIPFDENSGQREVCGIAIDPVRRIAWMADWTQGRFLYMYDLRTGKYIGKKQLLPVPSCQQGIALDRGSLYITADDGDADLYEPDHLYRVRADPGETFGYVERVRAFTDFTRAGEIEGLCFAGDRLLVLMNRGSRIVQGKVEGFYPGYDQEIHEVYIYNRTQFGKSCSFKGPRGL
jgi:hypothetical protein